MAAHWVHKLFQTVLLVLIFLAASASASDFTEVCDREFHDDFDDDASDDDVCCPMWRAACCVVDHAPADDPISRELAVVHGKTIVSNAGCTDYISHVGGSMPASCYWRYRKWLILLCAGIGIAAALVPAVALVMRRMRRNRSSVSERALFD
jgi:hypothetical protein